MTIEVPHPPWWNTRDRQAQPPGQPLPSRQLDLSTATNNNINNKKKKKTRTTTTTTTSHTLTPGLVSGMWYQCSYKYVFPLTDFHWFQDAWPPSISRNWSYNFPGCRLRLDANDSGWMPGVPWFPLLQQDYPQVLRGRTPNLLITNAQWISLQNGWYSYHPLVLMVLTPQITIHLAKKIHTLG